MSITMHRDWHDRNVDLNSLQEKIADFFNDNDFDVAIVQTQNGYQLTAKGSPTYSVGGLILVTIEGKPEEFSIRLELQKKPPSKLMSSPILLTLIGGGYFLSQRLKADDAWLKFKNGFWQNIERIVTDLSRSRVNQ